MTGGRDREQARLRMQLVRYRAALRDPTTGLESFSLHVDAVREMLTERRRMGVLHVSLSELRAVESVHGWEEYDALVRRAAIALTEAVGGVLPEPCLVAATGIHADAFAVFVAGNADGGELSAEEVATLAAALESRVAESVRETDAVREVSGSVRVGAALLVDNPFHRFERRVQQALDEARRLAEAPAETQRLAWMGELQRLVRDEAIHCLFQPIVDLATGKTVALEAFSRGPRGSALRYPRVLFSIGRDAGLGPALDRLCRRRALEALARGGERAIPGPLFLNTSPESLLDPEWLSAESRDALRSAGLTERDVVLECAERQLVADPALYREGLDRLRGAGYRFSLDDVGSGARSVMLIESLRPSFVKIDSGLARGAGAAPLARELVRSLAGLAERTGACLVAERVETENDRDTMRASGAHWGQGWLFGRERPLDAPARAGRDGWPTP